MKSQGVLMEDELKRWRKSELHKVAEAHELRGRFSRYLDGRGGPRRIQREARPVPNSAQKSRRLRWVVLAVVLWVLWRVYLR